MRYWSYNSDERRRRLERAAAGGDVGAAEQLLLQIAREGSWFLPGEWKAPGGHGPPYVDSLNDQRATWVRLLGYLKWEHAAQFQQAVAGQAPVRGPIHEHGWSPDGLEYAQARHLLGQARPFTRIGPEVAKDIGPEVMEAIAEAAAWEAFQVSAGPPTRRTRTLFPLGKKTFWDRPMDLVRKIRQNLVAWRNAYDRRDRDESDRLWAIRRQWSSALNQFTSSVRMSWQRDMGRESGDAAIYHAREALDDFFGAPTGHPSNARYDQVIFHAIMALGFACDMRKGLHEVAYQGSSWGTIVRTKSDWGDRFGASPSRGCMTIANRAIKKAMLPAAIVVIAAEMTKY